MKVYIIIKTMKGMMWVVFNPIWLKWLEEDEDGNLTILKKDTYQYFREDDKIISEKIKLKEKFH